MPRSPRCPTSCAQDVRLLGKLLGQVIAEQGGEDLLADVERLRKAVIAARRGEVSVDEITAMVASGRSTGPCRSPGRSPVTSIWPTWPRSTTGSASCANATPRSRVRAESLAQAVQELGRGARRRAGRGAGAAPGPDRPPDRGAPARGRHRDPAGQRPAHRVQRSGRGASERAESRRRLLEEIDLLWRTAQLSSTKLDPLDEVRTAMAAFDETLFRMVPQVYRSLDAALGEGAGTRPPLARPFIRYGSWIGGDRDGNPNVTAKVTRDAVQIQSEHVLTALENACTRIGRTLTAAAAVHAAVARAGGRRWPPPSTPTPSWSRRWPPARRASRTGSG